MRKFVATAAAAAMIGAGAATVSAGTLLESGQAGLVAADSIIGEPVAGMTGEELGSVDDVLIDRNGRVVGLLINSGGVLGVGGKKVAVAWQDVGSSPVVVDLTKEEIAAAPDYEAGAATSAGSQEMERLESSQPPASGTSAPTGTE